ncbi:MAG: protoporphyrinogen oxidase HemJ [Hyphomicrobium sp.]|nr:protoporphyrinogen oxidase HemJ [Hyphomicrobium sp.]
MVSAPDQPLATAPGASAGKRAGIAVLATVLAIAVLMVLLGDGAYLWIKAIHVVAIISWMAGLLYLPRLFIYHCDAPRGSPQSETFKVMERRLLMIIMTPAMIIAWVLGVWLAYVGGHLTSGWFLAKFAAVIALSGVHGMFSAAARAFGEDRNEKPPRYWRMVNEIPTVLMIVIVILVVVKPF